MRTVEEHQAVVDGAAGRSARSRPRRRPRPGAGPRRHRRGRTARFRQLGHGRVRRPVGGGLRGARSPVRLPVAEDILAGRSDVVPLAPGTVHRIMTGAPLPPGADVVSPSSSPTADRRRRDPRRPRRAATRAPPARTSGPGPSRSRRAPLGAAQLGLAAAVGVTTLPVRRRPRVLVPRPPASELVEPGRRCGRGRSTSPTPRCWPPPSRTPAGRPAGCTSSRTTWTSSSPRCGPAGADLLITSGASAPAPTRW